MASFVLDTSIALKWFLDDESDRAPRLLILQSISDIRRPVVPYLWFYEVANTLLVQVRRKRIDFNDATEYLNIIETWQSFDGAGPTPS